MVGALGQAANDFDSELPQMYLRSLRRSLRSARLLLPIAALAAVSVQGLAQSQTHARDRAAEDRFVNNLLQRMTLDEKLGQMSQNAYKEPDTISHDDRVRNEQVGSFLFLRDPGEINRLQHIAVEHTRLHIPLLFGYDVIHGFRTIFPVPIALSSSWDPAVAEEAQSDAAKEAHAYGINWTFAPMIDVARDARWGRMMESPGEDPYLASQMAAAEVRGFQGPSLGTPDHILATAKHFAAYGAAEGGRDYDASNVSDEQLWNVYLPPFHAAEQAGVGSFMSAYMDLNGVPASANRFLLHEVLRQDWGFQGMVVTDWGTVPSLITHGFAADPADAAARAVNAGVDMEMTSSLLRGNLAADLKNGTVRMTTIDDAVRHILRVKYELGLFEHPYVDTLPNATALVDANRPAARRIAEQTAVLLRNEDHTLPLQRSLHSIALIGPLADSKVDIGGSWSLASHPEDAVTVLEGLRQKVGSSIAIHYAKGVEIARPTPSIFDDQFPDPPATIHNAAEAKQAFDAAVEAVKQSDVAVLVLGELQDMNGENASRASLTLPGAQEQLLEAAVATGKPVVLVLMTGRPLDLNWASQHTAAILNAWYPGTEGGDAIADLLFGDANPSGKLPVSWPRSAGQEPFYYARNLTQDPQNDARRYWDLNNTALYPFGYGLSYTTFALSDLQLDTDAMPKDGSLHVTVTLKNTGAVAGDEVVQLYTHQRAGTASRPRRELKGFRKIHLTPGESRVVTLELPASRLSFWSPATQHAATEPGVFDLWVGTDSDAKLHTAFRVTP
jgi:beta-glucosidase